MQTFLPYPNFFKTVRCLDWKRLGKQRVEAYQLINILTDLNSTKKGWRHHPAALMWSGFEESLKLYCNCCISEWISRGYKNNMKQYEIDFSKLKFPCWFGNDQFHSTHRSNLLRKNFEYYSQFGWKESADLEYFWPVQINKLK